MMLLSPLSYPAETWRFARKRLLPVLLSFLALLAYAMRGVGAAPTVVRRAAPRPAPSVSPGQDAPGA